MPHKKAHLHKLLAEASECTLLAKSATDKATRDRFTRLAAHYKVLAAEVQKAIDNKRPLSGSSQT